MKYLALIYTDEAAWDALSEEEREEDYSRHRAFAEAADGKIVDGAKTASTRSATTVRVRNGDAVVSDGPVEELREPLGGFFLLECGTIDEAVELARQIPSAATGAVEVRPAYVEESA